MTTRTKEIKILGLGSIGILYGYYLSAQAGYKVSAFSKTALNSNISVKYFQELNSQKQLWNSFNVPTHTIHELHKQSHIPLLLVTTQAADTKQALKPLFQGCINQSSILILLQNGVLGVYEELLKEPWFSSHENGGPFVILGASSHGVLQDSPDHYIHTGSGSTYFGSLESNIPCHVQSVLNDLCNASTLDIGILTDPNLLKQQLVLKLIVNICINSLASLFMVKNGALSQYESARVLVKEIIQECWFVFKDDLLDYTLKDVENLVFQVCNRTSQNYNSMLMDLKKGQSTEIDYILGYLIQRYSRMQSKSQSLDKCKFLYSLCQFQSQLFQS